jgi:hypothetical protein
MRSTLINGNQSGSRNAQSVGQELADREAVCDSSSDGDGAMLQAVFTAWAQASQQQLQRLRQVLIAQSCGTKMSSTH